MAMSFSDRKEAEELRAEARREHARLTDLGAKRSDRDTHRMEVLDLELAMWSRMLDNDDAEREAERADAMAGRNGSFIGNAHTARGGSQLDRPGYGKLLRKEQPVLALGAPTEEERATFRDYLLHGVTKRGQVEMTLSEGGVLVPAGVSRALIDQVRDASRAFQAGVQVALFKHGADAVLPEVVSGPSLAWRGEGDTITESQIAFAAHVVDFKSLAVLVRISRELLMDSMIPMEDVVISEMAKSAAAEIDRAVFYGSGMDNQPRGIVGWPGVNSTVGGSTDWSDISQAALRIRQDNFEPTSAVLNPLDDDRLAMLRDAGATGSWLAPPPHVSGLWANRQLTNKMAAGTAIVGAFDNAFVAVREQATVLRLSEKFADTGELGLICHYRVDTHVTRPGAFEVITGLTA